MLWIRYFTKETLKVFFLFLFSFYFLYVLIDYSSHGKEYTASNIPATDLAVFYLCHFSQRALEIASFALLISLIRVATHFCETKELVAFMAAGFSKRKLSRPFFLIAFILTLFLYVNNQWIVPRALRFQRHFESEYLVEKQGKESWTASPIDLGPDGKIIYQNYDPEKKELFDVYWIVSSDKILRIKTLQIVSPDPLSDSAENRYFGQYVEVITRNKDGFLAQNKAWDRLEFKGLTIEVDELHKSALLPMQLPISTLLYKTLHRGSFFDPKESTALFSKLLFPLIPLLLTLGIYPFCLNFERDAKFFLLYALALFALTAMFTVFDAGVVLSENQVLSPMWALLLPFVILFSWFGWRFKRVII